MRPEIDDRQSEILGAFYSARRDYPSDQKAKTADLERAAESCNYEPDLCLHILRQLDDYLLKLVAEKLKSRSKK